MKYISNLTEYKLFMISFIRVQIQYELCLKMHIRKINGFVCVDEGAGEANTLSVCMYANPALVRFVKNHT